MEYWDCGRDGLLTVYELQLCALGVRREGSVDGREGGEGKEEGRGEKEGGTKVERGGKEEGRGEKEGGTKVERKRERGRRRE